MNTTLKGHATKYIVERVVPTTFLCYLSALLYHVLNFYCGINYAPLTYSTNIGHREQKTSNAST